MALTQAQINQLNAVSGQTPLVTNTAQAQDLNARTGAQAGANAPIVTQPPPPSAPLSPLPTDTTKGHEGQTVLPDGSFIYVNEQGQAFHLSADRKVSTPIDAGGITAISQNINNEMARDEQRSNIIGDSFLHQGAANMQSFGQLGDAQLARSNTIGDSMQGIGAANAAQMDQYGQVIGNTAVSYMNQGAQNTADSAAARGDQTGLGNLATGQGMTNFDIAANYGNKAAGDYAAQQGIAPQQAQNAAASAAAGQNSFAQAQQAAGNAATSFAQQQGARNLTLQNAGTAASTANQNMAQGAAYGGTASQANQGLNQTQGQQLGIGNTAGGVSAQNQATSNALLGQAGNAAAAQDQSRNALMGNASALGNFATQGPGPSMAEAQLKQGLSRSMAQSIALSRSGRGLGADAANQRAAMFSNAAQNQQTNQSLALVRAQEAQNYKNQQLSALGQQGSVLGGVRSQDQGMYGQALGSAGQFAGLGYQGLGLNAGQANQVAGQQLGQVNAYLGAQQAQQGLGYQGLNLAQGGYEQARSQDVALRGQDISNQQAMTGLGFTGLGQQQQGLGQERGQDLTALNANLAAQNNQTQAGYQGLGLGAQQANTSRAQDISELGVNNQSALGYSGLAQDYRTAGQQNELGYAGIANNAYTTGSNNAASLETAGFQNMQAYAGLANDQYQAGDQLRNQELLGELSSETSRYGADRNVAIAQAAQAAQRQAANMQMAGAGLAAVGMMASDERMKTGVRPMEGQVLSPIERKKDIRPLSEVYQQPVMPQAPYAPLDLSAEAVSKAFHPKEKSKSDHLNIFEKIFGPKMPDTKEEALQQMRDSGALNYGIPPAPGAGPGQGMARPYAGPMAPGESVPLPGAYGMSQQPVAENPYPLFDYKSKGSAPYEGPDYANPDTATYDGPPLSDERAKQDMYALGAQQGHQAGQAGLPQPTAPTTTTPQPSTNAYKPTTPSPAVNPQASAQGQMQQSLMQPTQQPAPNANAQGQMQQSLMQPTQQPAPNANAQGQMQQSLMQPTQQPAPNANAQGQMQQSLMQPARPVAPALQQAQQAQQYLQPRPAAPQVPAGFGQTSPVMNNMFGSTPTNANAMGQQQQSLMQPARTNNVFGVPYAQAQPQLGQSMFSTAAPSANANAMGQMQQQLMSDERKKYALSPIEAKRDIRPVSAETAPADYRQGWNGVSMAAALQPQAQQASYPSMSAPIIRPGALGAPPAVDLRPAQGYSYKYKNPAEPGAAPGEQIGPMAQHLELTKPGASVVHEGPDGMKRVDTQRLALVNTAAISEQQRKMQQLEQMVAQFAKPQYSDPTSALDAAYARQQQDVGPRYGGR